MVDVSALISQFSGQTGAGTGNLATKQADVAIQGAIKQNQISGMPTDEQLYQAATASANGRALDQLHPVARDAATLNPLELFAKYGPEANQLIERYSGARGAYSGDRTAQRMSFDSIKDDSISAGLGLTTTLGSIPAAAVGLVSPEAGVWGAKKLQELNDFGQSYESAGLQDRRRAYQSLDHLDIGENTAQYDKDKATDGNLMAGLKRIGRDTLTSIKDGASDPMILQDGIATGVGSMAAFGPVGKGLSLGARAILPAEKLAAMAAAGALDASTGTSSVARMIAAAAENPVVQHVAEEAPNLAAMGAVGGGGAYEQTVNTALNQGASVDQANKAGLEAAAFAAPASIVAGGLSGASKFLGDPLAKVTPAEALLNTIRGSADAGVQGGAAQLSSNLAIKDQVNPNQDLTEGVGGQVGLGALNALGSAAAIEVPALALHAPAAALEGAKAAAGKVGDALAARGEAKASAINAEAVQKATDAQNQAVAGAPELNQQLHEAASGNPELQGRLNTLFDSVKFDPSETAQEAPVVQQAVQGATDRYQALRQVAKAAEDPSLSDAERAQAGAYLTRSYGEHQDTMINGFNKAMDGVDIPDNHPAMEKLQGFMKTVSDLGQHPWIKAAVENAQEAASKPELADQFSDKALSTPEGVQDAQHTVNAVIDLAARDPNRADPKVLDTIRAQVVDGRLQLTDAQKATLDAAHAMVKATQDRLQAQEKLGLSSQDQVSHEIQTQEGVSDPEEKPVRSAMAHAKGVMDAVRAGDLDMARTRLQDMGLFAQHMQNKVQALNSSYADGDLNVKVGYQALSPDRGLGEAKWFEGKPQNLKAYVEGSVKYAQNVATDARAVTELHNGVADAYPQLGVKHIDSVPLQIDPSLEKPAADIVKAHQKTGEGVRPGQEPQKTASEPEVKSEPQAKETQPVSSQSEEKPTEPQVKDEPKPEVKAEQGVAEQPEPTATGQDVTGGIGSDASTAPQEPQPYERLLGSKDGKNGFVKGFRQATGEDAKSHLVGLGDKVVKTVTDAFTSAKAFLEQHPGELGHKLTPEILDSYKGFLGSKAPEIQAALEKRLAGFLAKTNIDKAKPENPAQNWIAGRVLNLVEEGENGQRAYHPELMQSAVLAGLQWLLTTGSRPNRILGEDEVGDMLGMAPTEVDDATLDLFNQGNPIPQVKQDLAATITRFWGVTPDPKAPMGFTKGIPEAMAAEVLKAMTDAGVLQFRTDTFGEGKDTKTFNWVDVADDEVLKGDLAKMAAFPSAIEQLALAKPQEIRFIGKPPEQVAEFQMRNRLVRNTDQQKQSIRNEQDTPHYVNPHMVSFLETLGRDLTLDLFANGDIESQDLNKNHRLSLKGQNATVEGAFNALQDMVGELRNKAEAAEVAPEEMPIHYEYNVSRVGRLHMLGLHNPQSSKLMREAILPTRVTLDMTKPENQAKFMLSVAQAWGEKVHKQSRDTSVEAVKNLASGQLNSALEALDRHLDGQIDPEQLVGALKEGFGDKLSPAAIHAGLELARFYKATDAEKSAFKTDLYVEADGVTDGPINALVHISTGKFTPRWVQLVAKGGLFLGSKGMTVNDFVRSGPEQGRDLYQATTDAFRTVMSQFRQSIADDPAVSGHANALMGLMDRLLPDLSFDEQGNLEIARGIAKNPLTVTIYGSGAKGIAGKVTGALTSAFYEELSKAAQGRSNQAGELKDMIEHLSSTTVSNGKNGLYLVDKATPGPRKTSNEDYTLSPEQVKNLQQNVLHLFVGPLRDAIESTISDTQAGRTKLREAVQVQSIFAQHMFRRLVDEELDKLPEGERKLFLSQATLDGIYKKLSGINPLIETGTQSFLPAGSEKSDVQASEFARSLDSDLSSSAYIYGPTDAGVAGIPYLVIGPGDGQMMQNLSTMKEAPQGTLKVFDGVHLRLDQLDEDAQKVNQSVYDAWQNNPLSAVNDSFQGFLDKASFEDMPAGQLEGLKRALFSKVEQETVTPADIEARVRAIGPELERLTQEAQARHDALAQVEMSVDHMASAEAPYQAEGEGRESLEGLNEEQIAYRLNELASTPKAEPKEVPEAVEAKAGTPEPSRTAEVVPSERFSKLVNSLKDLPAEQKNLLKEAIKPLVKQGWEIVRGTPEQTAEHALSLGYMPHQAEPGHEIKGYTALSQKRIYLHNDSAETLLHEVLHAAVTQKILDHYQGQTAPEVSETVTHLETLRDQWVGQQDDLSGLSPEQRDAYTDALNQMKAELNVADRSQAENKAAALDEFMAWNLSNQDLIKLAQQTKVENPIARVVKRALVAMKNLIWGRKMAPMVRSDMYSALRFNASVLINSVPTMKSKAQALTRYQSKAYGDNDRVSALNQRFMDKLGIHLKDNPDPAAKDTLKVLQTTLADQAEAFHANGFPMSMQEKSAFINLMTVMATQQKLNQASMAKAHDIYTHVVKQLKPSSFMADPESLDPNQEALAQRQRSILTGYVDGRPIVGYDGRDVSTLLPAFLALGMVHDGFREVLSKVAMPKGDYQPNDHIDNVLTNIGNGLEDRLSETLAGTRSKANVQEALDGLSSRLFESTVEQNNFIAQSTRTIGDYINLGNDKAVEAIGKASDVAVKGLTKLQDKVDNKVAKSVLEVGKLAAKMAAPEGSKAAGEGTLSLINKVNLWRPLHEFIGDLVGETDDTAPLHALNKQAKGVSSKLRQEFREKLPSTINERFTEKPSEEQQTHLHQGLGKTDLIALEGSHSLDQIRELLSKPAKVRTEVKSLETDIRDQVGDRNWELMQGKAQQLAHFMMTGEVGHHLLRNAEAIAHLMEVKGATVDYEPSKDLVSSVDRLTSLYALDKLSPEIRETLSTLAQKEPAGLDFMMSYLSGLRSDEQAKLVTDQARFNHFKGYIPSEARRPSSLIVAHDSEKARLTQLGYKRVADYKGSFADRTITREGDKGYYYSPVSGHAPFEQGGLQNARMTASGVDPVTGYTHNGASIAGRITDPLAVKRLSGMNIGDNGKEPLMPVFKDGKVVAYERSMDPSQEVGRLKRNTNLSEMIGAWRGRQVEESLAGEINKRVIKVLGNRWAEDRKAGKDSEYVDLFSPSYLKTDPVVADAMKLLTPDARRLIKEAFGADGFKVRKDMLNDSIGYRKASVGDLWTGNTRLDPRAVAVAKNAVVTVFGADAYKYMVTAERLLQGTIEDAKRSIIVRSMIVPMSNLVANVYQMSTKGIGLARIAKDLPAKFNEVSAYAKRYTREMEADAELRVAEAKKDVVRVRELKTELQSIQDINKQMSLWPLIQAGELSGISNQESLGHEGMDIYSGKIHGFMEKVIDRLPPGARSAARYAMITPDTPLFHGLAKAMEYGDFLAKAITYDHLVEEKGLSPEDALGKIREEYVNYDKLRGRTRSYLESSGLMWFWNYKIRITKIALAHAQSNPLHLLLTSLLPPPPLVGSVGMPMSDNIFVKGINGKLGYTLGPHMGVQAETLNPWHHLFGLPIPEIPLI